MKLHSIQSATDLHKLLKTHDPAPRVTTQSETVINSINTISALDTNLKSHAFHLSPAKRNPLVNTNFSSNYSKYEYPSRQLPCNHSLAKRNPTHFNVRFQIQNVKPSTGRETQFYLIDFPFVNRHSNYSYKSQLPKIKSVLFGPSPSQNQSTKIIFKTNLVCHQNLNSNKMISINKINMHLKKLITRIMIGYFSPMASSNISTQITPSPRIPTFNKIIAKVFSKSLITLLTSICALLKEVSHCIVNSSEVRLK